MKKNSTRRIQRTTKVAFLGLVVLSLLTPQGLALANSDSTSTVSSITVSQSGSGSASASTSDIVYESLSNETKLKIAAGEIPMPSPVVADLSKVKFTKEQAIAKLRDLFPILNKAETQSVELGNNYQYPAPKNQMIWNIQWIFQNGNSGYGFNSQVDAITGDLISTYISMQSEENSSYYPPKLSESQALEQAKLFISKAIPSIAAKDLKEEKNYWDSDNRVLFGPVQYGFSFGMTKNGIPSPSDYMNITIDSNGNVTQFSKSPEEAEYPSSVASISQAVAEKKFRDEFDVELSYIPVYKNGEASNWFLGWRPVESAIYWIDAITGKKVNFQGENIPSAPIQYTDVAQTKDIFQSRNVGTELTADEAVKLVEQVVAISEGRTLISSSLDKDYRDPTRKIWRLTWGKRDAAYTQGFPAQSVAEVDALTGEIITYRFDEYGAKEVQTALPAPSGTIKLTKESAKQKANDLVNRLYPNAAQNLKLVENGLSLSQDGTYYSYGFIRHIKGIPVSGGTVAINFDIYGRLQYYSVDRIAGLEKIKGDSVATMTKEEALKAYRDLYKLKLQYSRVGGYIFNNSYVDPTMRLVYVAELVDSQKSYQTLDATSGKWVTVFEGINQSQVATMANDLKGHWAEKDLSTLVEYHIITPDEQGNVKPNEVITVGEWLTLMVKAVVPYYTSSGNYYGMSEPAAIAGVATDNPYYSAVSYAAGRQWIDRDTKLEVDQKLTREQFAVLLMSTVKYTKLAALLDQDGSVIQFRDASAISNPGAVALAVKLGLLQGHNGTFNPKGTVTRAEAASVMMRLVKLQGKTDQAIGQQ